MTTTKLANLNKLLIHLGQNCPFYASIIQQAGLGNGCGSIEEFMEKIPLTSKQQIANDQNQNPPFGTLPSFPIRQFTKYHQTSGTMGNPLRWLDTEESWSAIVNNWSKIFRSYGLNQADRIAFAFSFGPFLGFWSAYDAACKIGAMAIPLGGMDTSTRLELIFQSKATVLLCTPTYALRLGQEIEKSNRSRENSMVKKIVVAGEAGGGLEEVRARIRSYWGPIEIYDHHGLTEVGPVTYACKDKPGNLHILEDEFIVEVVGEDGKPAARNGELILTNLKRLGMPLLRYKTGDLVCLDQSTCSCGAALVLTGGILGRADNMVVVRGVNVFPSAIQNIVSQFTEISEYRIILQKSREMEELALEIEVIPGIETDGVIERLSKKIKDLLTIRVRVIDVAFGSLPRSEMKANRFRRAG